MKITYDTENNAIFCDREMVADVVVFCDGERYRRVTDEIERRINVHDDLVEALQDLLDTISIAGIDFANDTLSRAKGELL